MDAVVCLANRRWSCYYERSQHLMSQCARARVTIFVEEPELDTGGPAVELAETRTGVITVVPHLGSRLAIEQRRHAQRRAIDFVLASYDCIQPVLWYYAPSALAFTEHVAASAVVYDWVDADTAIGRRHQQLLDRADLVFTDDRDHRGLLHHAVHAFTGQPSWERTWDAMWSLVEATQSRIDSRIGRKNSACDQLSGGIVPPSGDKPSLG